MKITGTITDIFEGTVASGRSKGRPFWSISFQETDEKLTAFKKEHVEGIKMGDKVTFEVTKTETPGGQEYINITDVPSVDVSAPPGATPPTSRERNAKNAISALQASVTFIAGALGGTATEEDVIAQAETFFEWIEKKMQ